MSRIDRFAAHNLATDLLKKAGFSLYKVSRTSESCYFHHPAREGLLLRLSTHKANKGPIGVETTLVNVSFTEHDERHLLTQTIVKNRVIWAIGYYFIADQKPSRYQRGEDNIQYKESHRVDAI